MKKYLIIVNPASGAVSKRKILPLIFQKMTALGLDCEYVFTKYPGHGKELALQAAKDGRYAVLACGGDGTVNEIASGLVGSNTALGIIPAGSGNGLARHLGIPVDIDRSLRIIAENNVIDSDYGTANGVPFFCTFGVGFDAAVSERCAREKRRGIMMYLKNGLNEALNYSQEEYIIEVNGKVITEKAFLVVCCNASQYGNNAFIAPQASVTDGELDIIIAHADNLIEQAIVGIDILAGIIRKNAFVDVFRASSARIIRKTDGAAHIDGDALKLPQVIDVECHPASIKVFSPTKESVFIPFLTPWALFWRDFGIEVKHLLHLKRKLK